MRKEKEISINRQQGPFWVPKKAGETFLVRRLGFMNFHWDQWDTLRDPPRTWDPLAPILFPNPTDIRIPILILIWYRGKRMGSLPA